MEAINKRYLCSVHFKALAYNKSHILKWNDYSYNRVWIAAFDTKVTHNAKRYLENPLLSDTHYPNITRTRQAWTYSPFLRYNSNKELHYSPGILRRSLGRILPRLRPWVTSQRAGLLHLPVKRRLALPLVQQQTRSKPPLPTHPARRPALREEVFSLKGDGGDTQDWAGCTSF